MLSLHGSLLSDPFSVPPPQPGTMSFDQAIGSTEPMEEEKTEETAPKPRRVRWEDSDEEAEEVVQQAAVADDAVDDHQAEAQDEEDAPLVRRLPSLVRRRRKLTRTRRRRKRRKRTRRAARSATEMLKVDLRRRKRGTRSDVSLDHVS